MCPMAAPCWASPSSSPAGCCRSGCSGGRPERLPLRPRRGSEPEVARVQAEFGADAAADGALAFVEVAVGVADRTADAHQQAGCIVLAAQLADRAQRLGAADLGIEFELEAD